MMGKEMPHADRGEEKQAPTCSPRIPSSSAATGSTSQPSWGGWREDKAWKCVGVPYTQTHFESV